MFNFDDPNSAMLLGLGSGLLSAGGPSSKPVNLGQAFGQAMPQAMQMRQAAEESQLAKLDRQLKLQDYLTKQAEKDRKLKAMAEYRKQITDPTQLARFDLDTDGFFKAMDEANKPQVVSAGGTLVQGNKPVYTAPEKLPDGMERGPDGIPRFIPSYLQGKKEIAAAGASQVNNIPGAKKSWEAFGSELPKWKEGALASQTAIEYVHQAKDQIEKANIGAGSNYKDIAQTIASAFGVEVPGLASSQTMDNAMTQLSAAIAKTFGANPSVYETQLLQILSGKRTLEKSALLQILDNVERDRRKGIREYNKTVSNFKDPELAGFKVDEPPEYKSKSKPKSKIEVVNGKGLSFTLASDGYYYAKDPDGPGHLKLKEE